MRFTISYLFMTSYLFVAMILVLVLLDIICRVSGIMGACLGNFLPEMENYCIIIVLDSWTLLDAVGSFYSELLLIGITGRCVMKFF